MRLIDADELKADLRQYFTDGVLDGISARLAFNQILHDIDNALTVERKPFASVTFDKDELDRIVDERVIEPIKNGELVIKEERPKGEWIYDGFCVTTTQYKCSVCNMTSLDRSKYCPNCGADMRGGKQ